MAYAAKVLKDSLSSSGVRLTTMEITFPRIVLAEFNTHRVFSRNSASSRAIPVEKRIAAVEADPFIPAAFGKNQKGMQASEELDEFEASKARKTWMAACADAVAYARDLANRGVHKQLANRIIEPFCWHTVIVSGTEWDNYDALRNNKMAQPEIRTVTELMVDARNKSEPECLGVGEWHLPFLQDDEQHLDIETKIKICVARCARVSYLTHDGKRSIEDDIVLYDRLASSGHMSPMEHVATPMTRQMADDIIRPQLIDDWMTAFAAIPKNVFSGNFRGWVSHRKQLPNEDNFMKVLALQENK